MSLILPRSISLDSTFRGHEAMGIILKALTCWLQDTCSQYPHRKQWSARKCGIINSELFRSCHSEVPPTTWWVSKLCHTKVLPATYWVSKVFHTKVLPITWWLSKVCHQQQYGRAGCIPFEHQQWSHIWSVRTSPVPKQGDPVQYLTKIWDARMAATSASMPLFSYGHTNATYGTV
jgi:hypothetical protein